MISKKILFVILTFVVVLSISVVAIKLWPQAALFKESFEFDGLTRTYLVNVPSSYDDNMPTPLVIVLHGYTGTAEGMETLTGFTTKSDEEGFIVVYPQGLVQRWNVGFGTLKFDTDDVGFINELINRLKQNLRYRILKWRNDGVPSGSRALGQDSRYRSSRRLNRRYDEQCP
jgi:poly(3-hydroxybutyrate) depolymerase